MAQKLPAQFSEWEGFVDKWSLPTEYLRQKERYETDLESIEAFYHALLPRMDEAIEYLNQFKEDELDEPHKTLFFLAMAFMEAAIDVERLKYKVNPAELFPIERMDYLRKDF